MSYEDKAGSKPLPFKPQVTENFKNYPFLHYQAYPIGKNKIYVRLENLYDLFDAELLTAEKIQETLVYFNLNKFATSFWLESNPTADAKAVPNYSITEQSLSANQPKEDNEQWKNAHNRAWKGVDDANRSKYEPAKDLKGFNGLVLEH